jgi:hypothetical protein
MNAIGGIVEIEYVNARQGCHQHPEKIVNQKCHQLSSRLLNYCAFVALNETIFPR